MVGKATEKTDAAINEEIDRLRIKLAQDKRKINFQRYRADALLAEVTRFCAELDAKDVRIKELDSALLSHMDDRSEKEIARLKDVIEEALALDEYPERWEYLVRRMFEAALVLRPPEEKGEKHMSEGEFNARADAGEAWLRSRGL